MILVAGHLMFTSIFMLVLVIVKQWFIIRELEKGTDDENEVLRCAKQRRKTMPRRTDDLLKDVETYFSLRSKRIEELKGVPNLRSLNFDTLSDDEQLIAELAAKLRERGWQDISTAPEDGQLCVFKTDQDLSYVGLWFKLGVSLSHDLELMHGEKIISYIPLKMTSEESLQMTTCNRCSNTFEMGGSWQCPYCGEGYSPPTPPKKES